MWLVQPLIEVGYGVFLLEKHDLITYIGGITLNLKFLGEVEKDYKWCIDNFLF